MLDRIRRLLVVGVSVLVVAGAFVATPALAESDAVTRAKATLAQIQEESSQIDADYASAQAAYTDAQAKLKQAEIDIVKQTEKVEGLKTTLAQIAISQYQNGSVNMTAQLLASPDESSFLSSLATLQTMTERANGSLQDVQVEQAKLDRLRADSADYTARMKAEQDKQAALVKSYDDKEARAKAVLDGLQAAERAQLLAAQNATTQAAAQSAAPAAAAAAFGSGASGSDRAQAAVDWARTQVGKPYVFGSSGPNGYDCSGLTSAAYLQVGISLPHSSQAQFRVGTPVDKSDLRPGDLLFFYGGITHVGLYAGNGVMVHSAPSGRGVFFSNLATYPSYQGARRVA